MWSKVFVGLLVVNIVTLAIWLALTESGSNGGGEVGKEGCLHVKQVILSFFLFAMLGKPPCKKSAVFLNIVQKAFAPPPFCLNIMW